MIQPLRDQVPSQSLHGGQPPSGTYAHPPPPPLLLGDHPPPRACTPPPPLEGVLQQKRCLPSSGLHSICILINPRPEFIRHQRLYKMCLVIVCFFSISERGPEPQREIKKKTPRKKVAAEGGKDGELAAESSCGPGSKQTWMLLVGQGERVLGPLSVPGLKGEGRMDVSSLWAHS